MANVIENLIDSITKGKRATESSGPTYALKNSVQTTKSSMGTLSKVIGSLANVGKLATLGLGPVGAILTGITAGLMAPIDMIKQLADMVVNFVGLVNPGAVEQFTLAMNDAMAVMGGMLTPIMQGLTIYVRAFGDALAKLSPILQPIFDVLAAEFVRAALVVGKMVEAFAPFIELLVDTLVPIMDDATKSMAFLGGVLAEVVKTIAELFGLKSNRLKPDASAQGAAIRKFSTQSTEGFSRALFEKQLAMMSKGGQGKDPLLHIPDIAAAIREGQEVVKSIAGFVRNIWNWFERQKQAVDTFREESAETVSDFETGGLAYILGKAILK